MLHFFILHNINYNAQEIGQIFDKQYFDSDKHKLVDRESVRQKLAIESRQNDSSSESETALGINTDLVRHDLDQKSIYKTLLHKMRNVAKTNWTVKEVKENRRPRICFCGAAAHHDNNNFVELSNSTENTFFFHGVTNCGGYWRCPVCALKISSAKKELVAGIINLHFAQGLQVGFITLTIRHTRTQTLKYVLDKILKNYRSFQNTRLFSREKQTVGFIGQIKTLEITFGQNGWHPHLHLLYFYDSKDSKQLKDFQKRIIKSWATYKDNNSLQKSQDEKMLKSDISHYLQKYDIASEMTSSHLKSSKGLTSFTALGKIALGDYKDDFEKRFLYGIYTRFVEETQNKHYVNISNTLRTRYHEFIEKNDKSDQQIVDDVDIDRVIAKISLPVWKKITKNDLQPLILNKMRLYGFDSVLNLLSLFKDFENIEVEFDKNDIPIIL